MTRAVLLEAPRTPEEWNRWSYHHRDSHQRIRAAVFEKSQRILPDYPIDPIAGPQIGDFLQYNSQLHADMNGALGQQSTDLLSVNFNNNNERLAWIALHYQEHYNAEQALGI